MRGLAGLWQRLSREQTGATAVEFALTMPILLMIMFAIMGVSQGFYIVHASQYALDGAVRLVLLDSTLTETQLEGMMAQELARLGVDAVDLTYAVDRSGIVPVAELSARVDYPISFPLIPDLNLGFNISKSAPFVE